MSSAYVNKFFVSFVSLSSCRNCECTGSGASQATYYRSYFQQRGYHGALTGNDQVESGRHEAIVRAAG